MTVRNKILLVLLVFISITSFSGCKLQQKLNYDTRNVEDSVENLSLKQQISVLTSELEVSSQKLKKSEDKALELVNELNISEYEKQQLKESIETITKEYNDQGTLIKETTTKKVSEIQKYVDTQKKLNTELTEKLNSATESNDSLIKQNSVLSNTLIDLNDSINSYKQKESKLVNSETTKFMEVQWWMWILVGVLLTIIFNLFKDKVISYIKNKFSIK